MFKNRDDAGQQLSSRLKEYQRPDVVVYALPRGGVVIGYEIAHNLGLPLELVITRKISHPNYPEYAIGAVSQTGKYIESSREENIDKDWFEQEIQKEQKEAIRRKAVYCGNHQEISIKDRTAIIVDDGVATGLNMSLAIAEIKSKDPKEIIVAVPVISRDVADEIAKICDKLVAIETIEGHFGSVGNYYESFKQVSDGEVIKLLRKIWKRK